MSTKSSAATVLVGAMFIGSGLLSPPAIAIPNNLAASTVSTHQSHESSSEIEGQYSNEEVLELLLAGSGRIAHTNPEVPRFLGFDPNREPANPQALATLISDFLNYWPNFSTEMRPKLSSGNPVVIEQSLKEFTAKFHEFLRDEYSSELSYTSSPGIRGGCDHGAKVCVTVLVAVVANVAIYANVVGATFVAAAAAVAAVVGPVVYLDDKSMNASNVNSFEKDELTRRITLALAE